MSNYYIDPMWFYFINTMDNLRTVTFIILILCITVTFILTCYIFEVSKSFDDPDALPAKKKTKFTIIADIILILVLVFVPSKETCIEMMVAQTITPTNVEYTKREIEDMVDYIFERVDQMDSEEK